MNPGHSSTRTRGVPRPEGAAGVKPPFSWNAWLPPPRRSCVQTQLSVGLSQRTPEFLMPGCVSPLPRLRSPYAVRRESNSGGGVFPQNVSPQRGSSRAPWPWHTSV